MRRIAIAAGIVVAVFSLSFGQSAFKNGQNVGTIGIGLGLSGVYGDATLPPIAATFDHGINDKWSIGGLVGYAGSSYKFLSYSWDYSYIIIAARGAYHFDVFHKENIDTYVGAMLGYNIVSVSTSGTFAGYSAGTSYLSWAGFLGGRYYFTPNINATLELGYGISLIRAAIGFKL
jgi:hypothetical protein